MNSVKTVLIKFIHVPFASLHFQTLLNFLGQLHLKQLISIVLDALNQVLHRIPLQTNLIDQTSSNFKFKTNFPKCFCKRTYFARFHRFALFHASQQVLFAEATLGGTTLACHRVNRDMAAIWKNGYCPIFQSFSKASNHLKSSNPLECASPFPAMAD